MVKKVENIHEWYQKRYLKKCHCGSSKTPWLFEGYEMCCDCAPLIIE